MRSATAVRAASQSRLATDGDEITVRLTDDLLAEGLADVRWLLHDALLAGARRLVIDLSEVHQLSSTAVASFLFAHRTCRARGGAVVLRGANPRTLDLLHRTGLWRVIGEESGPDRPSA
jgi:anti-anti-sigma factor